MKVSSILVGFSLFTSTFLARAADLPAPTTAPSSEQRPGEVVPSEDSVLKDFHSLGLIDGRVNIFRCASPVRDLGTATTSPSDADLQASEAHSRIQHLYDLGIRTIICLEDPDHPDRDEAGNPKKAKQLKARIELEKAAATDVGITMIFHSMNNAGPNSMQTMTDAQVKQWLDETSEDILKYSRTGGVVFHCSAGHDRTGIVAAYIRIKYEHWPVDQAIGEMRRYGHNWHKFSNDGGISSWQEDHLRAIAKTLTDETADEDSK